MKEKNMNIKEYSFYVEIDGKPENYTRERYSGRTKRFYNKKSNQMLDLKRSAFRYIKDQELYSEFKKSCLDDPNSLYMVYIDAEYFIKIPKGDPKYIKDLKLKNIIQPITRPDIDNYEKFTADSLHGVFYDDDKRIVSFNANKKYGESEKTKLNVKINLIELL